MALEVYLTRTVFAFRGKRATQSWYWLADNAADLHPWALATEIQFNQWVTTDWGFYLLSMISEQCFLREIKTWRILPTWGPAKFNRYASDEFPGRWLGALGPNFTTANIRWTHSLDLFGKYQNRIGPIGVGADADTDWYPLFRATAGAFILEHVQPRMTFSGVSYRSCSLSKLGLAYHITNAQLAWPPGRQANRRWIP